MQENIFFDIGAMIVIATCLAYFARLLKQPKIPTYVIAGLILGPMLGLITNKAIIMNLSEIGIAFLLFTVGLEMDLKKLRNVSIVATLGSTIMMVTLFSFAFVLSLLLYFKTIEAVYIGLIVAFSSTMVVIKLLSDKREIDTLHGRIAIGILLMQDIIAILALSILLTINDFSFMTLTYSLIKGLLSIGAVIICGRYLFPPLFKISAKSREMLFLMSVTVCFLFAMVMHNLGFSIAIGAFLAGLSLANLPYNVEIISRVASLKDFFATLFFVSLGLQLSLHNFMNLLMPLIILFIFVLIVKPLVMMFVISFFGFEKRTSFITSSSLAQISEFSLIIVAQGLILGHISQDIFEMTVLLAIVSIISTSYIIQYNNVFYKRIGQYLTYFDIFAKRSSELEFVPKKTKKDIILCGYNRIGYSIVKKIKAMRKKLLVIDYNPEVIRYLIRRRIACLYGDVSDIDIFNRVDLKHASMIISTVANKDDNILLIKKAKRENKKIIVLVTASYVEDALDLYEIGADYVILPHYIGGDHVSVLLEDFTSDVNKVIDHKVKHINELYKRHILGRHHPSNRHHHTE